MDALRAYGAQYRVCGSKVYSVHNFSPGTPACRKQAEQVKVLVEQTRRLANGC